MHRIIRFKSILLNHPQLIINSLTTNLLQTSDQSHLITSINPIIGIAWEGFKFGYSYDLNLSKMGGNGGVSEFSIVYDFLNDKECFGCPDY